MQKKAKKDRNHRAIVDFLWEIGAYVIDLSACAFGVPDLLIYYRGEYKLIEIKSEKGVLTDFQKRVFSRIPVIIVHDAVECAAALGLEIKNINFYSVMDHG